MSKLEEENKRLRQEKQALESALAQAHLKTLTLESTLEVASEHFGVDVKKSFGTNPSSVPSKNESTNSEASTNSAPSTNSAQSDEQ